MPQAIAFGILFEFVRQRVLTNFFVLHLTVLDAPLFTVRVFFKMICECMAPQDSSSNASATTGHIRCPDYSNLHKGDEQVVGFHTGREASLSPHMYITCWFGMHCWNSYLVGHTVLLHFTTSCTYFAH